MKKFITTVFAAMALVAAPVMLTSCNDDDEPTEKNEQKVALATPKYKSQAKKLTLGENAQGILSIELTESGDAILIVQDQDRHETRGIRGTHAVCGAYVVASNGMISLKVDIPGAGEITVGDDQITIGTNTVRIEKVEKGSSAAGSEDMFRTWNINKNCKVDGVKVDLSKRKEFQNETGYPTKFIMTKAGTFAVQFSSGSFEAGTYKSTADGKLYIEGLESYQIEKSIFTITKIVTLGCTIDGTSFEIYLESQD